MIRINGRWHYEPLEGDISWMQLVKALRAAGIDIKLKPPVPREVRTRIWIEHFGEQPVPVPSTTLITVRGKDGQII